MGKAGEPGSSLQAYLVFTVFVTGGVIMVVELLGSRVIGPSFGVSLFVWTSLITVTLVSLSLGYWLGGRLADIKNTPGSLYAIILGAGLYMAVVPYVKGFVLAWAIGLVAPGEDAPVRAACSFLPLGLGREAQPAPATKWRCLHGGASLPPEIDGT